MKVFLGGTVNGSKWRDYVIPRLEIDYFNPVTDNWDEKAMQTELLERENCDFCLYVLTPKMQGVYAVAQAVDDSFRKTDKTLFCFLETDGDDVFDNEFSFKDSGTIIIKDSDGVELTYIKK